MKFEKIIYISHAYGGKDVNREDIEEKIKRLIKKYPDYLFISPVHTFGFLYDVTSYKDGLDMCLGLLKQCDECWVIGNENSTGVKAEIEYCENNGILYKILEYDFPCKYVCHKKFTEHECLNGCDFSTDELEYIGCQLMQNKKNNIKFFKEGY